ncbi:hypothetical protein DITRI_Ditri08aG0147600 [Diplodiscus trichospermus]
MKKAICKALKNPKQMEAKFNTSSFNKDGENGTVISILREVEAVTISVLESLLSFISGPEEESKLSRWSLVSKLMHHKRNVENVQKELQNSELCIQDLEGGVESLFRRLIKARVTILNILNCNLRFQLYRNEIYICI